MRGQDPTRVPVPCHAYTETFLELFILPQFFQFSSSRNFQQKLPNRAKPGCQRLLNSCSRAKTGLALLLGPRGSLPLKKANASPDPPPLSTQEAGEGRAPSPQHSRQTPRRDAQVAGEEHRRELTHLALERAHCLQRSRGLGATPLRSVEVLLLRWRTFPPRDTSYADGLLSPFDDRPRWDAVTVGLDVDHER